MSREYTYLVTTRKDREEIVVDTLEKYYGELLESMTVRPSGIDGIVLVETAYELPGGAFERMSATTDVRRFDGTDPERIASACTDLSDE